MKFRRINLTSSTTTLEEKDRSYDRGVIGRDAGGSIYFEIDNETTTLRYVMTLHERDEDRLKKLLSK